MPVCHSYWIYALEPVLCKKRIHRNEKALHLQEQPPLSATREEAEGSEDSTQLINK